MRYQVDQWRKLSNPTDWLVTPETATLLQHWRQFKFNNIRPFFCQVEAVETAIWLTEVAPKFGKAGKRFIEHITNANRDANPDLSRLALKLATGASESGQAAMASLPLATHTAHRGSELQAMYARFEVEIEQLNERVLERAGERPTAGLLMTHPGVGPITALATDVFLGDPKRFRDGKAVASYIGIIPRENSSGGRQRLGGLTKQGNPLLRFSGVRRRHMRYAGIRSCVSSIGAN